MKSFFFFFFLFLLVAKKKSLFDDQPVEVQELIYIIKQDITSLNKQISQLQELSKARNNNHGRHMQSHSNSVVVSLQSKLASMSNDFRHVLEVRTQNLKHQKQRREQFTDGPVSATLPASALSGHTGSILLSDDYNYGEKEIAVNMDGINQQQMQLIDEQDSYIQTRSDAMQNIEATIVELGTIFKELAHMVKEQEELVQRIDSNVEDAQLNVEAAHSEILKFFQSVTSNRWLMLKVFGVLIIFFIIFVVFVA
ncbi:syntaxin-5-like [Stegodyphus dumicola]|uniref:syntaxin-5-like n=1 Tax=Stegodyphus dumicola TaxID=202533 RepID=UPI0015ADAFFE|nr:syntaxin-5-like [Stegodyphus dumicola]